MHDMGLSWLVQYVVIRVGKPKVILSFQPVCLKWIGTKKLLYVQKDIKVSFGNQKLTIEDIPLSTSTFQKRTVNGVEFDAVVLALNIHANLPYSLKLNTRFYVSGGSFRTHQSSRSSTINEPELRGPYHKA